jgi:hypothetical protein
MIAWLTMSRLIRISTPSRRPAADRHLGRLVPLRLRTSNPQPVGGPSVGGLRRCRKLSLQEEPGFADVALHDTGNTTTLRTTSTYWRAQACSCACRAAAAPRPPARLESELRGVRNPGTAGVGEIRPYLHCGFAQEERRRRTAEPIRSETSAYRVRAHHVHRMHKQSLLPSSPDSPSRQSLD